MNITLSQRAAPTDDVLFQEVGGEAVLLNLKSESYFGLDEVGTRVWRLLGEDPALAKVFATLRDEYDVEPDRLEADLLELVSQMSEAGLVRVS
jgi:hypothetical protein